MIVVKLQGGLGNQLFQYAFGRSVALRNRQKLLFDLSGYDNDYLGRRFSLQHFRTHVSPVSNKYLRKLITPKTRLNQLAKKFDLLDERTEHEFSYKEAMTNTRKAISFYNGYWQSYKYFESIRKQLLDELTLVREIPEMYQKTLASGSPVTVSIHVRRTDYLKDDRYGFIGEKYYTDALQIMKGKLDRPRYLVFSDDIEWCRQTLHTGEDTEYISDKSGFKDYEELVLMSRCTHHIIANSSFSWWGGWLNDQPGKIVVRPARPFRDPALLYEYHYPENWVAAG